MTFWKKIITGKTRDVNQEFCGGGGGGVKIKTPLVLFVWTERNFDKIM